MGIFGPWVSYATMRCFQEDYPHSLSTNGINQRIKDNMTAVNHSIWEAKHTRLHNGIAGKMNAYMASLYKDLRGHPMYHVSASSSHPLVPIYGQRRYGCLHLPGEGIEPLSTCAAVTPLVISLQVPHGFHKKKQFRCWNHWNSSLHASYNRGSFKSSRHGFG